MEDAAPLGPASDWPCGSGSPVAAVSGAPGDGTAVADGTCLRPCDAAAGGATAGGATAGGGTGGAPEGAMLVQQRYSKCEQMLGSLEAAVQQVDARFRCRAAPSSPCPCPCPRPLLGASSHNCLGRPCCRRQAKASLSTSVEGLAGFLQTQPESAELVLQARREGILR